MKTPLIDPTMDAVDTIEQVYIVVPAITTNNAPYCKLHEQSFILKIL